jgi:hypothetical protein
MSKNHWGGGGQGSHNKPIGCSASGTYGPGPDDEEEEEEEWLHLVGSFHRFINVLSLKLFNL